MRNLLFERLQAELRKQVSTGHGEGTLPDIKPMSPGLVTASDAMRGYKAAGGIAGGWALELALATTIR